MANSVDRDEMLHYEASHLGQHCLLIPVCLIIYGKKKKKKKKNFFFFFFFFFLIIYGKYGINVIGDTSV